MAKKKKQQSAPVPIVPLLDTTTGSTGQDSSESEETESIPSIRRRVNVKLFVALPVVAAALGAGVHFLHAYQVERSAGVLLQRAEKLLSDEKPKEAARYLRQYVGFRPDDVEALVLLADTLKKTAKTPRDHLRVYLTYEQVLRLDGSRTALRREQVERAIRFRRSGDARVHLEALLDEFPTDGELRFFAGVVEEADRHFDKAATYYHAAIASGYQTVEVHVRLAQILREHLSDPQTADRIIEAMVDEHKTSAEAFLARAVYRKEYGTFKQALADVVTAEKLDSKSVAALLLRAEWILSDSNRSPAEVKEIRDKLNSQLTKHAKEPRLYLLLSRAEVRLQRTHRAIEVLRRGLKAVPDEVNLIWPLAELLISDNKSDEAAVQINHLRELKAAKWVIDYLTGRSLYNSGKILAARTRLESASMGADRSSGIWSAAHLLLGQCYRRMGAFQRQLDTCGQVVDADPLSTRGRLGMAEAYGALGRRDEALKIYLSLPQVPGTELQIARLLFARNLRSPADKRDWTAVETVLNRLAAKTKPSIDVELMRAALLVARGQRKQAVQFLEQLQKRHPENVDVRCSLARLAIHAENWKRAETILMQTQKELGDSATWRITWADLWRNRTGSKADKALGGTRTGSGSVLVGRAVANSGTTGGNLGPSWRREAGRAIVAADRRGAFVSGRPTISPVPGGLRSGRSAGDAGVACRPAKNRGSERSTHRDRRGGHADSHRQVRESAQSGNHVEAHRRTSAELAVGLGAARDDL